MERLGTDRLDIKRGRREAGSIANFMLAIRTAMAALI